MRYLLLALALTVVTAPAHAGGRGSSYGYGNSYGSDGGGGGGSVYVRPYTRDDGSYVQPHYRSAPNDSTSDNWSTRGNSNPYTGRRGTSSPW